MLVKMFGRVDQAASQENQPRFSGSRSDVPWRVRVAAWRFSSQRSDYYDYVASCLNARARHRSLLELFQADAVRHRPNSARSVLANWWAKRYLASGGNLGETFFLTLPSEDVACLNMTHIAGQQALIQMLQSMSSRTAILDQCRYAFIQTVLAGLVALAVATFVLAILPLYTLPELLLAFSSISPSQAGSATRVMVLWVSWVGSYGWLLPWLIALIAVWVIWSVRHWVGGLRDRFDGFGVWRLERDRQAIHFLSLTAALIQNLGPHGFSLRSIVQLQWESASPWLGRHLMRMLTMMDMGVDPVETMNTGLIDAECWSRLSDVVLGYGLTQGFAQAGDRVQAILVTRLRRQATVLRWMMLVFSAAIVLAMGFWHARVIEEMRHAMLLGLSGF